MALMLDAEIFEKVQMCIMEALAVDKEEVTKTASLLDDLGAESIDLLDVVFRIERTFDIKIPRDGMMSGFLASAGSTQEELMVDGQLTKKGAEMLKEFMPEASPEKAKKGMPINEISTLFTAQTFANIVKRLLEAKETGHLDMSVPKAKEQ